MNEFTGTLYAVRYHRWNQDKPEYAVVRAHNRMQALHRFVADHPVSSECFSVEAFWAGDAILEPGEPAVSKISG